MRPSQKIMDDNFISLKIKPSGTMGNNSRNIHAPSKIKV
jgi:hypothetical protein